MKLVDNRTMQAIDRATQQEFGIAADILMENAGIRLFEALEAELQPTFDTSITFLAGGGNNGGDALVMARQAYLHGYRRIAVISFKDSPDGLSGRWLDVATRLGITVVSMAEDESEALRLAGCSGILVDGITGTGISGALRGKLAAQVKRLSALEGPLFVAVDAPTGIGDGFRADFPVLPAALTLTVAPARVALYRPAARQYAGRIRSVEIGFPAVLIDQADGMTLMDDEEISSRISGFSPTTYKNRRGHLAVFAGSTGTAGAAVLACRAAARGGAGLVTLFIDSELYLPTAAQLTAAMVRPREAGSDDFSAFPAVLIGPGWGLAGRESLLKSLLKKFRRGLIDADGLTLLAGFRTEAPQLLSGDWVLTPHPGECARLLDIPVSEVLEDQFSAARQAAMYYKVVVLLKGHVSCVAAPDGRMAVIDGMNPMMGTGGTGDLLAGFIGGFLADTAVDPFNAAACGAYLHQKAGRLCAREAGLFSAEDLVPYLGRAAGAFRNAEA